MPVTGAAAQVFEDSRRRRLVLSFVGRARSLSEAAAENDAPLGWVHYHARRWLDLGLLKVVGEQARQGRPIKTYTAAAEAFFVADEHLRQSATAGLARELDAALLKVGRDENGAGVLFSVSDGRPTMTRVGGPPRRTAAQFWLIFPLNDEEAVELGREMEALLRRFGGRAPQGRRPYLLHAALAPRA